MDTTLTQKFPFILDRNLAKAKCTGNHVCTSCDKAVLGESLSFSCRYHRIQICISNVYFVIIVNIISNSFFCLSATYW